MRKSRIKGFYKLNRGERIDKICDFADIPVAKTRILTQDGSLNFETADLFVENAVGTFPIPLGIGTNFKINNKDYLVPMAVEESSVIAAASNAARAIYNCGGFQAKIIHNLMIGQIQLLDIDPKDFEKTENILFKAKDELLQKGNEIHPRLLMRGGGLRDIEIRSFPDAPIPYMVLHLLVDTRDAMGANLINTLCESLAPIIEEKTKARIGLKILSNLADKRLFEAKCKVHPDFLRTADTPSEISNESLIQRVVEAYVFANTDPYRAATHNKGIMNGVDPVVIATGNDWRAIEAGAHAYASIDGHYKSLSQWKVTEDNYLEGTLKIPLQIGTVGGVTKIHPGAQLSLQILGNPNVEELGMVMACSGLASNLAALRALCTSGIQKGHMKLHAKNLAFAAGAKGSEIEEIAKILLSKNAFSASDAENCLTELRANKLNTSNKKDHQSG